MSKYQKTSESHIYRTLIIFILFSTAEIFGTVAILPQDDISRMPKYEQLTSENILQITEQYCQKFLSPVFDITINPSNNILAAGLTDGSIYIWYLDVEQKLLRLEGHTDLVSSLEFNKDGDALVSASTDGRIKLWDIVTGDQRWFVESPSAIWTIALSPDGEILASGGEHADIEFLNINTGEDTGRFQHFLHWTITDMSFTPDGGLLAFAFLPGVTFLDVHRGIEREELLIGNASYEATNAIIFSNDGSLIATKSDRGYVRLWNRDTKTQIPIQQDEPTYSNSLSFSPDGAILAAAKHDGTILTWDADTGQEIGVLLSQGEAITSVEFSSHGMFLASGDMGGEVCVWGVAETEE